MVKIHNNSTMKVRIVTGLLVPSILIVEVVFMELILFNEIYFGTSVVVVARNSFVMNQIS